ncbi:MAG: GGDEF domain-containing protein [Actinomycetota bacterium]
MAVEAAPLADNTAPSRKDFRALITEQLRAVLEQRSVRLGAIGTMLVIAAFIELAPSRLNLDSGWMFVVPVAVSAIAGGLREGVFVALCASILGAVYLSATAGQLDPALLAGIAASRFALYGLIAAVLGAFAEAHYSVQSSLKELARTDPLTRVANVSRFYDDLALLEATKAPFALMVVDLDDLKAINDRHGHQTGSAAIQLVANVLRRVVRSSDCVARYGGDEFVIILKDADRPGAQIVSNRMRSMLLEEGLPGAPNQLVTVSVGVALSGVDGETSEELLAAADQAMYRDKRTMKKRVRDQSL